MSEKNAFVRNPARLAQRYFNITDADWPYLIVMGCALVVTGSILQSYLANFTVMAVGAIFFFKFNNKARLYYAIGLTAKDLKIAYIDRGVLWSAKTTPRKSLDRVIPLQVFELGKVGLIHNRLRGTVSCVVTGSGSDIASLTMMAQIEKLNRHADTTKRVASRPGMSVGLNYVWRIDSYNPWNLLDAQSLMGNPEIFIPRYLDPAVTEDELTRDDRRRRNLHRNYVEMNKVLNEVASEPVMAAIVTIKSSGLIKSLITDSVKQQQLARKARASKKNSKVETKLPSETDVYRAPIVDVATTCADGLAATGISDVKVLNRAEVEVFLRGATDITNMSEFYEHRHHQVVGPANHWPYKRILASRRTVVFDDTVHAVLRVTGLPSPSLPHVMRTLHAVPARWKSVSLVGETIRSTGDYFALGKLQSLTQSVMEVFGSNGGIKSTRTIQGMADQQEKVSNTAFMHLYNVLICLSDSHPERLHDAVLNSIKDLEGRFGVSVEWIKGESQQDRALWSSRAGINML